MIYLASPYSHPVKAVQEERFRLVCKFAGELMMEEYVVFCPIAHSHPIAEIGNVTGGWDLWAKQDLPLLAMSSELHVACLPGWEESEGVAAEIAYFRQLYPSRPIVYHHFDGVPC